VATPFGTLWFGFYEEIGRKGGEATRRSWRGFYEAIAKKAASRQGKVRSRLLRTNRHKGGQKVKKLIADAKARRCEGG